MLPAFPAIQAHFGVAEPNELQLLVYVYMIGFALMQLVYGPVSDIVGRRPTLMVGMGLFAVGCVLSVLAPTFGTLLAARLIQGMGAAAGRVLAIAIVRDCFAGREMARVMSITFAVFIIVPVFAPAMGSVLLLFGSWPFVFASMLALAVILVGWFWRRMPETLHPEYRFPFSVARIAEGVRLTLNVPGRHGILDGRRGFVRGHHRLCRLVAADLRNRSLCAGPPVSGRLRDHRGRHGRGVGRQCAASCDGSACGACRTAQPSASWPSAPCNAAWRPSTAGVRRSPSSAWGSPSAISWPPSRCRTSTRWRWSRSAPVAGTASSVLGFYTTLAGALIGLLIGQAFDATVLPLTLGYFGLGAVCLAAVLWAEGGVLFRPHNPDPTR